MSTQIPPAAVTQLRHLINYNLDNDLVSNALFLSGRLHGLDPRSPETAHLIALCHYKLGHFRAAYDYAKDFSRIRPSSSLRVEGETATAQLSCCYVFAQACEKLGRYSEGINALERCQVLWRGRSHWFPSSSSGAEGAKRGPDAAAVCSLLGKLCKGNNEEKKAAEWFAESLKVNPFMWDAFTELSDNGVPIKPMNIYKLNEDLRRDIFAGTASAVANATAIKVDARKDSDLSTPSTGYDPFNPTRSAVDPGLNHGGPNFMSRLNGVGNIPPAQPVEWDTPVHHDQDVTMDDSQPEWDVPPALPRKKTGLGAMLSADIDIPKLRGPGTRGKVSRLDPPTELEPPRPVTAASGIPVSHKRTASGQPPITSAPPSSTASTTASDRYMRRSARLQTTTAVKPTSTAMAASTVKSAASSRLAGVFMKDNQDPSKKEMPKAKATGTRGRLGAGVVGRNVSGNSKRFPPAESEKEMSRPASQASTVKELRETRRVAPAAQAANKDVIISQDDKAAQSKAQEQEEEEQALKWLLSLFGKLSDAYHHLSRYNAPKALDAFRLLPLNVQETPWVLSKIARSLYESGKYKDAADVFSRVRRRDLLALRGEAFASAGGGMESAVLEDMHIYSTILWHLKKEIELAYLAHELLSLDRLAPESWIALGNSFSLQRDHEKAIKCFRRATQLCSEKGELVAYAYTLMGHEHVAMEEFEEGTRCYQSAISANSRHYAGWYGLGSVYEKLGKYEVAERHYRIAWGVNPRNSVLAVCLGLVSEKLGRDGASGGAAGNGNGWVLDPRGESRIKEALGWYDRAVRMDPKSAKARFMRARTLLRLAQLPSASSTALSSHTNKANAMFGNVSKVERLRQAKEELETLREMAPQESMVHFLLGRCLKMGGDRAGAIREMTIALELDPKASPAIKEALESLEIDDEGSFDEDEDD